MEATINELKFSSSERSKIVELIQPNEEEDYHEPTKEQLIAEIKGAVREVNLAKAGKIKLKTADEFLNEL
ncbi:MAG: hypothetical protein NWQ46_02925 [Spirosomaceae bacterium]|nr:hypothetical protein [Spirosomataceae bacterium]